MKNISSQFITEYRERTFSHEGHLYDLNHLYKVSKNIIPMNIDVNELKWILEQSKSESDEQIKKADIKVPLLVTKYKRKILVIDGLDRLSRAIQLGKDSLPCKFILPEVLDGATRDIKENTGYENATAYLEQFSKKCPYCGSLQLSTLNNELPLKHRCLSCKKEFVEESKNSVESKELFTFITESKTIRNERDAQKYTIQESSEILFSMMLTLHLIGASNQCKKYCLTSLKFPKFNHIFLSSTDLANVISTLRNARQYLNQPNVDVPIIELKRYLRGIILGNNTPAFSRAFFMRLQSKLKIKNANLLILRREIVDAEIIKNKTKLADKLYQILRSYNNCDLLVLLQFVLEEPLTESINKVQEQNDIHIK